MLDESERRTATCVAITPVKAAVMAVREFGEMRAEMPEVAAKLEAAAMDRMGH
jgi:CRP-like cAMP-binding protein